MGPGHIEYNLQSLTQNCGMVSLLPLKRNGIMMVLYLAWYAPSAVYIGVKQ